MAFQEVLPDQHYAFGKNMRRRISWDYGNWIMRWWFRTGGGNNLMKPPIHLHKILNTTFSSILSHTSSLFTSTNDFELKDELIKLL